MSRSGLSRAAKRQPILLALDDMHWVDQSSLSLLHYISRNTRNSNVMLLGTYRPEDVVKKWDGSPHQLSEVMQKMRREELCRELSLKPLDLTETVELIRDMLGKMEDADGFAALIHRETEGNPLFICEVIALLKSEGVLECCDGTWRLTTEIGRISIPPKVHDIITRRVARLQKEQKELLEVAAVVGELFSSEVLASVAGMDRLGLLKMLNDIEKAHQLITVHEKGYRFSHVKIRDAVYESLLPELRKEYHNVIGGVISELFKENVADVEADIAHHYYMARNEECISHCIAVADRAKDRYQNEEALEYYGQAIEVMGTGDKWKGQGLSVLESMGDVYSLIGRYDKAIECFRKVLELAPGENERCARMRRKISGVFQKKGDYEASLGEADAGEKLVSEDMAEYWKLKSHKAFAMMWMGKYDESIEISENVVSRLGQFDGTKKDLLNALISIGTCSWYRGDYDKALGLYELSLEKARKIGDIYRMSAAYNNMGIVHYYKGDLDRALEFYEKSLRIQQKVGDQQGIAVSYINIGNILYDQAKLENALEFHNKSLQMHEKFHDPHGTAIAYINLGDVLCEKGEMQRAEEWYGKSIKLSRKIGAKETLALSLLGQADMLCAMDRCDDAWKLCAEAERITADAGLTQIHARCERIYGKILGLKKEWNEAEMHFESAKKELVELKSDVEIAKTWFDWGNMLLLKGDLERGRAMIRESKKVFKQCGMQLWENRCASLVNGLSQTTKKE